MNEQAEKSGVALIDAFKIVLAAAALVGGVVAYYWYESEPQVLRVLMVLGGLIAGLVILYWSAPGRELWDYVQSSRVELRKMVWPTRQETWRTTLVVFVFVLALGVFFWLVDMALAWGAKHVTGQGG
ncbi:MAG TPA: preprotein translocase subunit SecE [Steroidobacteraceae bacterium]|jgi:preprotein translocase subunit SecE|nr:preprotein translocase subunit SecE [Steroidobacteraceae bacterium]